MAKWTTPTRGVTRIHDIPVPVELIQQEVAALDENLFQPLHGNIQWDNLYLRYNQCDHDAFNSCRSIRELVNVFDAEVMAVCLARLHPGGKVGTHRDISGGIPAGVIRFHFPIITCSGVVFTVNDKPLKLMPGEVWHLDTSYPHSVANNGLETRIHLIVDYKSNPRLANLLPRITLHDRLHRIYFWLICVAHAAKSVIVSPRRLMRQISAVARLVFLRRSALAGPSPGHKS